MAAPTTPEEFLDLLRQSNLLEESDLERCRALAGQAPSAEKLTEELVRTGLLTPFHSTNLMRGRWRGFFLGKYRLLEQLGAGGMGQVFLATHQMMRRLVALKVLTLRPGSDPSILPRFQREARAMAVLDHPNIVHAYDCDQDDKAHYIVLEYVDGMSLSELVKKRGPVAVVSAVNYISQAALGLQHAHDCGIIHRDIKPGNMLLDRQGVVKILDMGLARLFHDHADNLTLEHNAGRALGTADYLAPEQVANSHDVDPRADIYSLGASLYYLLMGKAPFQGATVAQKLLLHQLKAPPSLRQLRPEIPEELVAVITQMMAKLPEERHATVAEVHEALQPWAGAIEPPAEGTIPKPCPAVSLLIQQGQPQPARNKNSGQVPLPVARSGDRATTAARATPTAPAVPAGLHAGVQGSSAIPAPAAAAGGQGGTTPPTGNRPAARPAAPPSPLPTRRESRPVSRGGGADRLSETPLAGSLHQSETEPLGRPAGNQWGSSSSHPPVPPPLPAATTEALFGNWMPVLNPQGAKAPWQRRWRTLLMIVGMLLIGGVIGIASNLFLQGSSRGDPGRLLTPAEAGNYVDQQRTVELRVRSIGTTRGGQPIIYLNSETDWKTRGNFSVLLDTSAVEKLRQEGVEDFLAHFKDRKIRATGTIQLYTDRSLKQNRLQMVIENPANVLVVEP